MKFGKLNDSEQERKRKIELAEIILDKLIDSQAKTRKSGEIKGRTLCLKFEHMYNAFLEVVEWVEVDK